MYQLAHRKQQQLDTPRTAAPVGDRTFAIAVGKSTLAQQQEGKHLGEPDFYNAAIDSAMRELRAVRFTALPAYVRALRMKDAAPMAREIAIARAAMQVRHLLLAANKHVFALEESQVHKDPMVTFLRRELTYLVVRSVKLGIYRNAEDMIPQRYEEPKKLEKTTVKVKPKTTRHKHADTRSSVDATQARIVRVSRPSDETQNVEARISMSQASRRRGAAGGSRVGGSGSIFSSGAGASSEPRATTTVRPGFRR